MFWKVNKTKKWVVEKSEAGGVRKSAFGTEPGMIVNFAKNTENVSENKFAFLVSEMPWKDVG